jgi:hypothetical protein
MEDSSNEEVPEILANLEAKLLSKPTPLQSNRRALLEDKMEFRRGGTEPLLQPFR